MAINILQEFYRDFVGSSREKKHISEHASLGSLFNFIGH